MLVTYLMSLRAVHKIRPPSLKEGGLSKKMTLYDTGGWGGQPKMTDDNDGSLTLSPMCSEFPGSHGWGVAQKMKLYDTGGGSVQVHIR